MKQSYKVVPLVLMMIALVSCYRDDIINQDENSNQDPLTKAREILERDEVVKMLPAPEKMFKVTAQDAADLALRYSTLFSDERQSQPTRSLTSEETTSSKTVASVVSLTAPKAATRSLSSGAPQADTLMHIVNFAGDEGFALISTDSREDALLAYSDNGNFNIADTVGNSEMKFHVDMIMAYENHRKEEFARQYEAQGTDYFGDMDLTVADEQGVRTLAAGAPGMPGQPGSGAPGMPGLPGQPENLEEQLSTGCIFPGYTKQMWNGNPKAIEYVERYHGETRCYGPAKGTMPLSLITNTSVYNSPPISTIDEYYHYYGCNLLVKKPGYNVTLEYTAPFVNTAWDQHEPLNKNCKGGEYSVGCAPLALLQIFAYYGYPASFVNTIRGDHTLYPTNLIEGRQYKYNSNLESNPSVADNLARFVRQIGKAVGVSYTVWGTAATGLVSGSQCIKDALAEFGYTYGYGQAYDFTNATYRNYARESIKNKKPVFIYGFPISKDGNGVILYTKGHCWVLHGYKSIRAYGFMQYFYFDERGGLSTIIDLRSNGVNNYFCANMGWGDDTGEVWVSSGLYIWEGDRYDKIVFLAGIEPLK